MSTIQFDMPEEQSSIIKVIGVGGGGGNAVNYMYEQGIKGVNFVICNTDNQALEMSPVPNKIQLGPTLTNGRGAGAVPEIGKNATIESEEEIRDLLAINTKMVFVTAGMGGGTGTGGAPEVAKIAKELGILTVGIVTIPFKFEGKRKHNKAELGIEEMRKNVDALIIISNNKLREIYGDLPLTEAFGNADSILSTAAKGISEIITKSGLINVDFEDVKTVMQNSGVALMGTGIAAGENRAIQAIDAAMASPLLSDDDINGAKGILLNITSGSDEIRMDEVTKITEYVQDAADDETEIIWGVCYDDTLQDEIAVTLIATGFEGKSIEPEVKTAKQRIVHNLNETPKVVVTEKPKPTATKPAMETELEIEPTVKNTADETVTEDETETPAFDMLTGYFNEKEAPDATIEDNAPAQDEKPSIHFLDEEDTTTQEDKSEKQPNMADIQRERMQRLKSIVSINKIKNNQNLKELEDEPAYMRKNVEFVKEQRSDESSISKYRLEDDYDGKPTLKENNSFLHDNVD